MKARTIETMTPQPAGEVQGELSLLADGLGTALDELREISRGIHPAILSEAGLRPALKALAFQVQSSDPTTSSGKRAELRAEPNIEMNKVYWIVPLVLILGLVILLVVVMRSRPRG